MTLKPTDYFKIGAIVAAVWLLALFRADQSRTNEYRPVGYRTQLSQIDDDRQAYARDRLELNSIHRQNRPRPASTVLAKSNFEKPVTIIAPQPVKIIASEPGLITEPEPVVLAEPKPVAITVAQPGAITVPKPVVIAQPQPVAITQPQPVAIAQPQPVAITEPTPITIAVAQPAAITQPEPVAVTPLPQTVIATEPEPVVHTQTFVPIERPKRYDLRAEVQSQVHPTALQSNQYNTESVDQASLKQQDQPDPPEQAKNFGRVSYPNGVDKPRSVLLKNNHVDLNAPQPIPDNSRLGDVQPPPLDSGGDFPADQISTEDFSSNTSQPQDFQFAFEATQDEIQPAAQLAVQPTLDPHVAQDSKMVRKVNWESIEPQSNLLTTKSQPTHVSGLVRQTSPPEIELRAFGATSQGKALATRGAYFAAKEEFINALMMIAESNDRVFSNRAYTSSLTSGLTALKESEDFATTPQRRDHSRNLKLVLASHETKVIDPNHVDGLSFSKASEIYCQFAQVQIEQAIGQSDAGSSALFYLSRLLSAAPEIRGAPAVSGDNVKRATLLASLTANPSNFEAANELGVLFYSEAWYKPAAHWFTSAVRTSGGNKLFWQNLAQSHARIAETTQVVQEKAEHMRLAQLASQQIGSAPELNGSSVSLAGWVSPEQFQANSAIPATSFQQQAPVATAQVQAVQQPVNQRRGLTKRLKDWF